MVQEHTLATTDIDTVHLVLFLCTHFYAPETVQTPSLTIGRLSVSQDVHAMPTYHGGLSHFISEYALTPAQPEQPTQKQEAVPPFFLEKMHNCEVRKR